MFLIRIPNQDVSSASENFLPMERKVNPELASLTDKGMGGLTKLFDRELWFERFVLTLFVLIATFIWGFAFGNPHIRSFLNNQGVMFSLLSFLIGMVFAYAGCRNRKGVIFDLDSVTYFFIRHQWWLIFNFSISYAVVMCSIALLRHQAFQSHAFDLAIFDQAIWGTLKGKLLMSSFKGGICLLGDHMSPVLFLFSPLYVLWDDASVLLVAQTTLTALSFFPLALIAQEKLGKGAAPIVFSLALFFYQPLRHSIRADFHPEFLTNPLIFLAFYFLYKERMKLFFLTVGLIVLCKENMFGISFVFGLYFLFLKRFRTGCVIALLSIALFWLTTQFLIPRLGGLEKYFYSGNYSYLLTGTWGTDPPLFAKPAELFEYLFKIFLPVGLLSFFDPPTLLLTGPILFQNILSRNPMMHSIAFQYTSGLTPTVFISAIFGMASLVKRFDNKARRSLIGRISMMMIITFSLILAGKPERQRAARFQKEINAHKQKVKEIVRKIPERFSVTTNETLAPHLSHRFEIYQFEDFQRMPHSETYPLTVDLVILDRRLTNGNIAAEVNKVEASGYKIVYEWDGFFILQRKELGNATFL